MSRLHALVSSRPSHPPSPRGHLRLLSLLLPAAVLAAPAQARPRLAVVLIFDQLRATELERYAPFFGRDGFGGLGGAHFDAVYSYAGTETGPGHATLATGANPEVHGIAANHWYRGTSKQYVVDDPAFPMLGASGGKGRSANMLVAPTLGDTMKAESGGRAKVVAVSHKDRGAILSVGKGADVALWYDAGLGRFTTSTAYAPVLPSWVADLGAALPTASFAAPAWTPLPVPAGLEALVPADDRAGEGGAPGLTAVFPHNLAGHPLDLQRDLYRVQPSSVDDLFTLALRAVDEVGLGRDGEPDLLVVSVSTTDYVGHNFGPDSLEQLDLLRRADASVRRFVAALESRVRRKDLVIALSSDHGAPPLPAAAEGQPWPHGIIARETVTEAARAAAARALPGERRPRILGFEPPQLFLDETELTPEARARLRVAVAEAVNAVPGIARVYDFSVPGPSDAWEGLMRATAFPGRAAQLFVRQAARVILLDNTGKLGTDHGSPYLYDRRVPLIVAGAGVRPGRYATPVDPRDVAPTLAFLLGVPPPDMAQGRPIPAVGD